MAADPLNQPTVRSVKKWLDDCKSTSSPKGSHTICSSPEPAWIPSRLIEVKKVGGEPQIHLVQREHLDDNPEYTALSYRWGDSGKVAPSKQNQELTKTLEEIALSTKNQESYWKEIPWKHLPKTLQDAAVTTHELGIRFLWIDSLCIIQDDKIDKAKEIGQMTQVYAHATLTIMPRRANSARDPFLNERSAPSGSARFPFKGEDGQETELTLYDAKAIAEKDSTVELDRRGWCFQEHLLSRRILEIGTWVTEWSCRRDRGSPSNADGWCRTTPSEMHPKALDWTQASRETDEDRSTLARTQGSQTTASLSDYIMFLSTKPVDGHPRPPSQSILNYWWNIVSAYTMRSLSVQTDRPLAISGIAERFASLITGGRYVAGLWVQDLSRSLLWAPERQSPHDRRCLRATEYQGPSWSWTAINRPVYSCTADRTLHAVSKVLSVECVPLYQEAPFGALKSGMLRIIGPALSFECRGYGLYDIRNLKGINSNDSELWPHGGLWPGSPRIQWDTHERMLDWTHVTLLALLSGVNSSGAISTEGLALTHTDGHYRRFGQLACFGKQMVRNVTILGVAPAVTTGCHGNLSLSELLHAQGRHFRI